MEGGGTGVGTTNGGNGKRWEGGRPVLPSLATRPALRSGGGFASKMTRALARFLLSFLCFTCSTTSSTQRDPRPLAGIPRRKTLPGAKPLALARRIGRARAPSRRPRPAPAPRMPTAGVAAARRPGPATPAGVARVSSKRRASKPSGTFPAFPVPRRATYVSRQAPCQQPKVRVGRPSSRVLAGSRFPCRGTAARGRLPRPYARGP